MAFRLFSGIASKIFRKSRLPGCGKALNRFISCSRELQMEKSCIVLITNPVEPAALFKHFS